jgi:serine phosphatase RsbU (regulator of sigma subunit)
MDRVGLDFIGIAEGLFVTFVGLIGVGISLFRLRNKDFTLLNFGVFCFLYGIRWLIEIPTIVNVITLPLAIPDLHGLLTYLIAIPLSAFLVNVFGRGLYNTLTWFFWSTIIYAVAALAYDAFHTETMAGGSINPIVVVIWCVGGLANLLFIKGQSRSDLRVVRSVFIILFICVTNDNLVSLRLLPWALRLEHLDILVLCFGLGYVAVRRFFSTEKKLLTIEQEMTIARRIQRSNLPGKLPAAAGIAIGAKYVPMTSVAGDFYDIQTNGETGAGILIADVSGHGVGAALVGSMLKIAFASQQKNLDDPARMLTEINRILRDKMEDSFVTACALYIDIESETVRYANAGHPPPILWRKSGREISRLSQAGMILGPFPNVVYENGELSLAKGDRLVLFTDGLVEVKGKNGELFGDQRFESLVDTHSSDTVEVAVNRIMEDVIRWSGRSREASLDDDLTLLLVEILTGRRHSYR